MLPTESPFSQSQDGYFMQIWGPASNTKWPGCQKKLCFVATDQAMLADVLLQLADRPDCVYVKYSTYSLDGMYLGRCFLVGEHEVGMLWAQFKRHRRLFCTVQDDDFTLPYRDMTPSQMDRTGNA